MPFNQLLTTTFYPPEFWRLETPLQYTPDLSRDQIEIIYHHTGNKIDLHTGRITVPQNFLSDLASIPRIMWWAIAPFDIARPAVIHDFLYRSMRDNNSHNRHARAIADKILLQGIEEMWPKVNTLKKYAVYFAVRLFGWISLRYGGPDLPDPSEYNNL